MEVENLDAEWSKGLVENIRKSDSRKQISGDTKWWNIIDNGDAIIVQKKRQNGLTM